VRSRILWLSFFALVVSLLPTRSSAQGCAGVMTPEYSSYVTVSYDADYNIYSTAGVDGYTSIGNTEYCPISGVTHRGDVCNTLGGVGGCSASGGVPPASYLGWTNPQEIVGVPGVIYLDSVTVEVICSAVGDIYSSGGGLSKYYEFAFTWMLRSGLPLIVGTNYFYPVIANCSNGTPDWYPATVEDSSVDAPIDVTFLTGSFMVRISTLAFWTSLGGFTIAAYPSTYPPEPCTHTGPQP
jgi:hypothetical protein